jgi:hypothetical protein
MRYLAGYLGHCFWPENRLEHIGRDWFGLRVANPVVLAIASTVTCPAAGRGRGIWAGKGRRQ